MSASTVVIKQPSSVEKFNTKRKWKSNNGFKLFAICMWGLAAIITSCNAELSSNVTGITVSITTQDCFVMLITTWFLARGLSEPNHVYVIPWLLMSIWSMYNCQYTSIYKMYNVLRRSRMKTMFPWIALGIDGFSLLLRAALSIRIVQLTINQWYNKKLRNELTEHDF